MTDLLAFQVTPTVPTGSGGPSPLALGLLLVVGGWLVQTQTGVDLVGLLPSLGGSDDDNSDTSSGASSGGGGGGLVGFVLSINGLAIGVLTLLSALLLGGAIGVPADTAVPFVVALELLAAALILEELEQFDFRTFAVVAAFTTVIALSAAGEPVLSAVLIALSGRWRRSARYYWVGAGWARIGLAGSSCAARLRREVRGRWWSRR